jgi:hypothetical protein
MLLKLQSYGKWLLVDGGNRFFQYIDNCLPALKTELIFLFVNVKAVT